MPISSRRCWTVLLLLCLPAAGLSCAKKPMSPALRPPDGGPAASVTLFGTLDLEMRHLDAETRPRYLREVAGQDGDPFGPSLVILFSIDNRGSDPVTISPSFAILTDRKGKTRLSPIDARELGSLLASAPAFTPAVARRLHQATFHVDPGRRLSRLLVFPAMDRKPPALELILPGVISGNLSADARFPFTVAWEPLPELP